MKHRLLISLLSVGFLLVTVTPKESLTIEKKDTSLKTIMQLLMLDMQTIDVGIWYENYQTIRSGAENIVNHPKIPVEERERIKAILGQNNMKAFAAYDQLVHDHADSLVKEAEAEEMELILKRYNIIQKGCVDCHTSFRKPITEGR